MIQTVRKKYLKYSNKYPSLPEIFRFVVVGSWNTILYLAILFLLSTITGIHKGLQVYIVTTIAFIVVVSQSYYINKKWTFKSHLSKKKTSYLQFVVVTVIGQVINGTLIYILTTIFSTPSNISGQVWLTAAGAISTGVSMIWNFIGYKFFVFKT